MGEFSQAALVRADQFHFNQRNVRTFVVMKVIDSRNQRGSGKLIHIQFIPVLPMHVIEEQVEHDEVILHQWPDPANGRSGESSMHQPPSSRETANFNNQFKRGNGRPAYRQAVITVTGWLTAKAAEDCAHSMTLACSRKIAGTGIFAGLRTAGGLPIRLTGGNRQSPSGGGRGLFAGDAFEVGEDEFGEVAAVAAFQKAEERDI